MLHTRGASRDVCSLLTVKCGKFSQRSEKWSVSENKPTYPFPEQVSSGHLEVHSLTSPSKDEFCKALESYKSSFVYLQGEYVEDEEVGSLPLDGTDYADPEAVIELFPAALPVSVYLEIPNGEEIAKALQSKGIPYVIYWKNLVPAIAASHFYNALCSLLRSSVAHVWDAFQLASASYRLYCLRKLNVSSDDENFGIHILGNPPEIEVFTPEVEAEEDNEGSLSTLPTIMIHDDEVNLRFLVCGIPCTSDEQSLSSLEDGLNALLTTEIRGSKLIGKFSVVQPLLQTESFSRDVVTMRCDVSTSSCAHVSFLLSGNAQICFDDQLIENHIKKEIIEKSQLVQAPPTSDDNRVPISEPRLSASVACGAKVFEVAMNVPAWASQVLRQLALDASHHGLVALGIASIQGLAVSSFDKDDAERLLFFCSAETQESSSLRDLNFSPGNVPVWLKPPVPSRKRPERSQPTSPRLNSEEAFTNGYREDKEKNEVTKWGRHRLKAAALRPIPRINPRKMLMFPRNFQRDGVDEGQARDGPAAPAMRQRVIRPASLAYRRSSAKSFQSRQIISLNPLPLKKHGCDRSAIQLCSEEEFLKDVMHFLTIRGHSRLIPQGGGVGEFPDAILNAKRLDLYNLYKEVVSRGGFHVGNGINWKGQVFSKMSNYTTTHRMTGVGNTLKRHYETYLLEYELAHDDVDGECCLICHSGAAGDWVNCGTCGEWAHFGCDRRQGLGAFKDYAKTDGLEYMCPQCSMTNSKKKQQLQRPTNGFSKAY